MIRRFRAITPLFCHYFLDDIVIAVGPLPLAIQKMTVSTAVSGMSALYSMTCRDELRHFRQMGDISRTFWPAKCHLLVLRAALTSCHASEITVSTLDDKILQKNFLSRFRLSSPSISVVMIISFHEMMMPPATMHSLSPKWASPIFILFQYATTPSSHITPVIAIFRRPKRTCHAHSAPILTRIDTTGLPPARHTLRCELASS